MSESQLRFKRRVSMMTIRSLAQLPDAVLVNGSVQTPAGQMIRSLYAGVPASRNSTRGERLAGLSDETQEDPPGKRAGPAYSTGYRQAVSLGEGAFRGDPAAGLTSSGATAAALRGHSHPE